MPAAHRETDICTGHGCFPPRPNAIQSTNVAVNSLFWHRQSDAWQTHTCVVFPFPSHASTLASGSPNVYVNSLQAARIGDPVACGSKCATGSPNVFANG